MAIVDWTFGPIRNFDRDFDRLRRQMEQVFDRFGFASGAPEIFPAVNVYEQDDDVLLAALVPGVAKDSLRLDLRQNVLTITGNREPAKYQDATAVREECPSGEFRRAVQISAKVQQEKIEASMKDGILLVRMPKSEEAKPKRIAIHA